MAAARKQALDIAPEAAARLGWSAVEAARIGFYVNQAGEQIDWRGAVETARIAKTSITPDDPLPTPDEVTFGVTEVQVTNETTLMAARRFVESGLEPLVLNFANGVQPGGGFLYGARAQEEVLCRSSALFETLVDDPMYEHHWDRERPDSTDWAIHSPGVPVFRDDDGTELSDFWLVDFLTCAAPYAPDVGQPRSAELLQKRIIRVLAIARAFRYRSLVLGAWGCGAFGNDTRRTAGNFREALENEFCGAFSDVVFAITDWSPERKTLGPFLDVFEG
ncbi:hypothetical protein Enr13x_20500 [Stieleria neptunia]|uniref:Microbial-type PARG catalytic domain-containing protein n=1 Tax=Stieleria neptunia TaxID=2527979 RepID=A0A518HMX4_9BACT|nr:TIGR02452 family protein [Stieleria neptunia]QDV42205.1 hypothetical protein Enr13x_20500 [Stieleria neptunia]